ncbi:hypothetical protein BDZ91DRAFT_750962, partial [Kalaharituber pfeilii]
MREKGEKRRRTPVAPPVPPVAILVPPVALLAPPVVSISIPPPGNFIACYASTITHHSPHGLFHHEHFNSYHQRPASIEPPPPSTTAYRMLRVLSARGTVSSCVCRSRCAKWSGD